MAQKNVFIFFPRCIFPCVLFAIGIPSGMSFIVIVGIFLEFQQISSHSEEETSRHSNFLLESRDYMYLYIRSFCFTV